MRRNATNVGGIIVSGDNNDVPNRALVEQRYLQRPHERINDSVARFKRTIYGASCSTRHRVLTILVAAQTHLRTSASVRALINDMHGENINRKRDRSLDEAHHPCRRVVFSAKILSLPEITFQNRAKETGGEKKRIEMRSDRSLRNE